MNPNSLGINTNVTDLGLLSLKHSNIINNRFYKGSGCGAYVEHTPRHYEVVGSNPAGCRAFFLFVPSLPTVLHQRSVLNQVPQRGASLTERCERKKMDA